jgi:hypothetical protein
LLVVVVEISTTLRVVLVEVAVMEVVVMFVCLMAQALLVMMSQG